MLQGNRCMPAVPTLTLDNLPATFGRYRVLKLLGRGGMGAVYLAHDPQLDRQVALKIPNLIGGNAPQVLERFLREARAAATILHPNVCPLHEIGECDGVPYLTMGYIEGRPLSAVLAADPQPQRQAALLVRKLALALSEAHNRGVIHRDLKPDNVMIDTRGEPIIMDFGLARRDGGDDARLTKEGSTMGTPAYMPPEQVKGHLDEIGPTCDVYSLGVILYEMLAGRPPFVGEMMAVLSQVLLQEPPPPSSFRPGIELQLEAICKRAMAKKPADRYGSMAEMAGALSEYLRDAVPLAEAATPPRADLPLATAADSETQPDAPGWHVSRMAAASMRRAPWPAAAPTVEETGPRRPPRKTRRKEGGAMWLWLIAFLVLGAIVTLLLGLGLAYYLWHDAPKTKADAAETEYGTIRIDVLEPAGLNLAVDDKPGQQFGQELRLSAGEHTLEVSRGGAVLVRETFNVKAGANSPRLVTVENGVEPAAPVPVDKSKLLVTCTNQGHLAICEITLDDSEPLTPLVKEVTVAGQAWSPDGQQVAFTKSVGVPPQHHIFILTVKDSTTKQVTRGPVGHDQARSWGINGKLLYLREANKNFTIWVVSADGVRPTQLSPQGTDENSPAWSPDGQRIAFTSRRDGHSGYSLYVMDADGKNAKEIVHCDSPRPTVAPAWSPDGKRIAYAQHTGPDLEIFVVNQDGTGRRQLTHTGGQNGAPAWKPDGKQIAFNRDGKAIYLTNADGSGAPREVFAAERVVGPPAWKPK
jgi:Tol biopolymer transport system component